MSGRAWRPAAPITVMAVLAVAVLLVSFAPWCGLGLDSSLELNAVHRDAWHRSGLWVLAVALGVSASIVAATLGHRRAGWLLAAGLALGGAALVLLPPGGPLCACGVPAEQDFGWFAYTSLEAPVIRFGSLWGRWLAAGLLMTQLLVAVLRLRPGAGAGPAATTLR